MSRVCTVAAWVSTSGRSCPRGGTPRGNGWSTGRAIAGAGRLPGAPAGFERRVGRLLGAVGTTLDERTATLADAQDLTDEVRRRLDGA